MSDRFNFRAMPDNRKWFTEFKGNKNDLLNQALREFRKKNGGEGISKDETELLAIRASIQGVVNVIEEQESQLRFMGFREKELCERIRADRERAAEEARKADDERVSHVLKAVPAK